MSQKRKTNILLIFILLSVVVIFAYFYNAYVTEVVIETVYSDREVLQSYNNEIIAEFEKTNSVTQWADIIERYQDIFVVIEDSSNKVVIKSEQGTQTVVDVKVQTPFKYKGEAYVIKTSVYFLREYIADVRPLVKFIVVELLIALSALVLLILAIYTLMLRPFNHVYKSIEDYDRTGKLEKKKIRGYAGQVYNRFVSLTQNLERQQQNENRIIASISHDIKTPLTSIMGYTEQLKKDVTNDKRKKMYLDTVYEKSVEIQQLIDEFDEYLNFHMLKELKTKPVSTVELEKYLKDEYFDELKFNSINLIIINNAPDVSVMLDMQKIKRVFGNIFSNSVKHLKKKNKEIKVYFNSVKDTLNIEIHDNGEGVSEEKLETIFEPFYTSDEGRKVAGLGLAICREIINSHSGKIYAKKSETDGLAICIEMKKSK